jgi:Ser-tRNA(Ala) deacylase AlaX
MTTSTLLQYLNDTYVDSGEGIVLEVGRDDRGPYIVLNQTIFYPQGGGQPSDTGCMEFNDLVINVSFVGFKDGQVLHYISEEPPALAELVGRTGKLRLDKSRRMKHARLHTAGHLIAGIIDAERASMRATKGFHFEEGPYVEFEGEPQSDSESLLASLQTKIDQLIAEAAPVTASLVSYDDLKQRCGSVPPNLPQDKPLRTITIETLDPVPCGGTHLACLSELGTVTVLKMKKRKGTTKISYQVSASPGALN